MSRSIRNETPITPFGNLGDPIDQDGTNEPIHPGDDATLERIREYKRLIESYTDNWLTSREGEDFYPAETIWCDFTCDFSPPTLKNLDGDRLFKIRRVLLRRGVHVKTKRGFQKQRALIECWLCDTCPIAETGPVGSNVQNPIVDGSTMMYRTPKGAGPTQPESSDEESEKESVPETPAPDTQSRAPSAPIRKCQTVHLVDLASRLTHLVYRSSSLNWTARTI